MSDLDLRSALTLLAGAGLLAEAGGQDDPSDHTATAITAQRSKRTGSRFGAKPPNNGWQTAAFLLADRRRLACTLEISQQDFLTTVVERLQQPIQPTAATTHSNPATTGGLEDLPLPVAASDGPDLAGILVLQDPTDRTEHLALVSLRRETGRRLTIAALPWRTLAFCQGRDAALDAALVIGTHPVCSMAAALSGAEGRHGWATAGALAGRAVPLVNADGIAVPAQAELVLRGRLSVDTDPAAAATQQGAAAFDVTTTYRRDDPILHWMAGGVFRLDADNLHAAAVEITIARHLRNVEGGIDVLDVRCYPETENQVVAVKLRPKVQGQSKTALMAALSSPDLRPRFVVGVDEDIDVTSLRDVAWSCASRIHAEVDLTTIGGLTQATAGGALSMDETPGAKWFLDTTMPPLTQPENRQNFERAVPKNLDRINLADFLPD